MSLQLTKADNAEFLFSAVSPVDKVTPVPLSNCTLAKFSVRAQTAASPLLLQKTSATSAVVINIGAGTVRVRLTHTDTATLDYGRYRYDVELTFSDSTITTLSNDFLDVTEEISDGYGTGIVTFDDVAIDDVKRYLGVTDTNHDTQIGIVLPQVIAYIKDYCGHDFEVVERSESPRIINDRSASFYLKERPVSEDPITVVEDGSTLTEGTDFYVYRDEGQVKKLDNTALILGSGFNCAYWYSYPGGITVTYTAGEELTQDVLQVLYEMVAIRCQMKTRTYIDNAGFEQTLTQSSTPKELTEILDMHVHVML